MRNTFRAAVAALGILGLTGTAGAQAVPVKIAFIDSNVILKEAPGTNEAQKMIQTEMAGYQALVGKWSDSLTAMQKAFAEGEATWSPPVRAQKQKELNDKQDGWQKKSDSLEKAAQSRQREVMQPILDMVTKVIKDIRDKEGYALVWDIGSGTPGVVAFDKNLDITDQVLVLVRKLPMPTLPAPAATKASGAPPSGPAGIKKPPPPSER